MAQWFHPRSQVWVYPADRDAEIRLEATVDRLNQGTAWLQLAPSSRVHAAGLARGRSLRIALPRRGEDFTVGFTPLLEVAPDGAWLRVDLSSVSRNAGLRASFRVPHALYHEVALLRDLRWETVRGIDLSVGGILVEGVRTVSPGTLCLLRLVLPDGGLEMEARVAWTDGWRAAFEFTNARGWRHERLVSNVHRLMLPHAAASRTDRQLALPN